jgi:hypothetical protein
MRPTASWLTALFLLTSTCYATVHSTTGTVATLHVRHPSDGGDSDWLSLGGVDALGTCKIGDAGHVVFLVPNDKEGQRMVALALASKTSGAPLTIQVDDTVTGPSGFCLVSDME